MNAGVDVQSVGVGLQRIGIDSSRLDADSFQLGSAPFWSESCRQDVVTGRRKQRGTAVLPVRAVVNAGRARRSGAGHGYPAQQAAGYIPGTGDGVDDGVCMVRRIRSFGAARHRHLPRVALETARR